MAVNRGAPLTWAFIAGAMASRNGSATVAPMPRMNVRRGNASFATSTRRAPTMAEKNGKYYFYYSADTNIGVAVSDSPTGPFTDPLGKPLIARGAFTGQMIDPAVFTDDDGQSYLYWGNGSPVMAEHADDMVSLKPGTIQAMSGLMELTGNPDGTPMLAGTFYIDYMSGMYATTATLAVRPRRFLDVVLSMESPSRRSIHQGIGPHAGGRGR